MARVYVAGSNEDKAQATSLMDYLRSRKHDVHDWTVTDKSMSLKDKTQRDFDAMLASDYVIFVNAGRVTPGKYIEIGACKVMKKRVLFIGKPAGRLAGFGKVADDLTPGLKALAFVEGWDEEWLKNQDG